MKLTPEQALERYEKQLKRQNEHIKENYDRVSATLPKGTKEQIKATGYSLNNFIAEAVREKLERLNRSTESEQIQDESSDFMNPPEEEQPKKDEIDIPECFK